MTSITSLTLCSPDGAAASDFYREALGPETPVRTGAGTTGSGFRGFILGVDVAAATGVDLRYAQALTRGADSLKAPKKQLWGGYSGAVRGADGTIVKIATSGKGQAADDSAVTRTVLLLGVADVKATQRFYVDHGLAVAKSFGSKYVEVRAPGRRRHARALQAGRARQGRGSRSGGHGRTRTRDRLGRSRRDRPRRVRAEPVPGPPALTRNDVAPGARPGATSRASRRRGRRRRLTPRPTTSSRGPRDRR